MIEEENSHSDALLDTHQKNKWLLALFHRAKIFNRICFSRLFLSGCILANSVKKKKKVRSCHPEKVNLVVQMYYRGAKYVHMSRSTCRRKLGSGSTSISRGLHTVNS